MRGLRIKISLFSSESAFPERQDGAAEIICKREREDAGFIISGKAVFVGDGLFAVQENRHEYSRNAFALRVS